MDKLIDIISYCADFAANIRGSAQGSKVLKANPTLSTLTANWIEPHQANLNPSDKTAEVARLCQLIAQETYQAVTQHRPFLTLGGDHSAAIGTWQGAANALKPQGPLGLIWMDAHLDAHTPESSISGNIHGMPVAVLLGHGDPKLTTLMQQMPALQPQHLVMIGIRSYEEGECNLLKKLNVTIFTDEDVKKLGAEKVFKEALHIATHNTAGFGISIDIDGFSPAEAPGVSTPEAGGLHAADWLPYFATLRHQPTFIGAEIVEFNPLQDQNKITEKLCCELIQRIYQK